MTTTELISQIKKKKSFLCIGLDVDLEKIPQHLLAKEDPIFEFNKAIIDATHHLAVAYKPNIVTETIFVFQKPMDGLIDKIVRSYSDHVVNDSLVEDGYERTNVWQFPPETKSKHLAPYPTALSDRIIKYYSFKYDLVLDPFMGSGTTAVSAKNLDRRWVGCELHEEYVRMAEERLKKVNPLASVFV